MSILQKQRGAAIPPPAMPGTSCKLMERIFPDCVEKDIRGWVTNAGGVNPEGLRGGAGGSR